MKWRSLLMLLCGCGSGAVTQNTFGDEPLQTLTTSSGLEVKLWTNPQPPTRGQLAVKFDFVGHHADDITAEVTPWMPAMGHGTASVSTDDALVAEGLSLYMPGTWELRTQLSGAVSDAFVVELSIP